MYLKDENMAYSNFPYLQIDNGLIIYINDRFTKLTGLLQNDVLNKSLSYVFRNILRVNNNNIDFDMLSERADCLIFTKNNSVVDVNIVPCFNEGLNYIILIESSSSIIAKDITEAVIRIKNLEKQLDIVQKKNERFQIIFDNMADGLYIEDYENDTVFVNKPTKDFFDSIGLKGKLPSEIRNSKCFGMSGKELSEKDLPITRIHKEGKYEQSIYTLKHNNKEIHLSISGTPVYDCNNQLSMALLCIQIMTDKINEEKELLLQRDLYYNIFDILGLPIVYLSYPNLEVYGLNRNAKNLIMQITEPANNPSEYHYSEDQKFFGTQMAKMKPFLNIDSGVFHKIIQEIKNKKEPAYYNVEINLGSQKSIYKMVVQPICDIEGSIKEVILTGFDITYEIDQKENLEKMAQMKDEFVYTITHEFKTPLTVINSAIQTLESIYKDELTDNVRKYLGKIKQNSFRQLRLVNNLLEANKMSIGKSIINKKNIDIVSLTKIITESVQPYAQQKGINLVFLTELKEKSISIDDEKYERVLLNLLSNAIKFTPKDKTIVVKASLKIRNKKQKLCIEVQDEGIGIPQDKLELIFERFWQVDSSLTRNTEGTGLGLSIVKQITEALGGEIYVNSEVGVGSNFVLLLPAVRDNKKPLDEGARQLMDNHLIHKTAIEFSDIYL